MKESKEKKAADKAPKQENKFPLILKGKTPAELAEQLDNLEAPEGATLYAGVVGRSIADGTYTLRVDIQPPKK